ncbi:glycine zipper family protein [Roseateles violae]|uniref:Glycine zipper family protein n=1 Tax=Roseateles violae TaxID=3058042 RepID=A0ABT8DQ58_9BURK|nr:glycine zipper family protein [Pelomonas sp. PFR6]MDN3920485.1 glycine zipper family protein [Pelomonas sp. PFR6]
MRKPSPWLFVLPALLAGTAFAQQIVYPAKGQSADQQKSDESACYNWAVQNTGIDPSKPAAAAPPPPPTTATGTQPGAGVRGAARGAVVGEIIADDAGAGAAVGAIAARGQSRRQNAAAQQQAQQQTASVNQQQQATFAKARAACLEGRGYTVK